MKTQKQVIISIGREFGSAGHEIAERIAKRYGLSLYGNMPLIEPQETKEVKKVKELDLVEVKNQDSKVDKLHYSCVYLKEDLQTLLVKNMLS